MTAIARPRGLAWPKTRKRVTPPRLRQTEAQYQAAIISLARGLGWTIYHTHDSRKSAPGFPDLVLLRPPRVIVAELKAWLGVLSPAQRRWLELFWACGVEAHVWRVGETDIRQIADILTARTAPVDIRPLGAPGRGLGTIQEQSMGIAPEPLHRGRPPRTLLVARRLK